MRQQRRESLIPFPLLYQRLVIYFVEARVKVFEWCFELLHFCSLWSVTFFTHTKIKRVRISVWQQDVATTINTTASFCSSLSKRIEKVLWLDGPGILISQVSLVDVGVSRDKRCFRQGSSKVMLSLVETHVLVASCSTTTRSCCSCWTIPSPPCSSLEWIFTQLHINKALGFSWRTFTKLVTTQVHCFKEIVQNKPSGEAQFTFSVSAHFQGVRYGRKIGHRQFIWQWIICQLIGGSVGVELMMYLVDRGGSGKGSCIYGPCCRWSNTAKEAAPRLRQAEWIVQEWIELLQLQLKRPIRQIPLHIHGLNSFRKFYKLR